MLKIEERLTKQKDFDNVYKKGKVLFNESVNLKFIENNLETNRYGIVVSNKVNKLAVERNKIKRLIREAVKDVEGSKGYDIAIIVKKEINKLKKEEIKKITTNLLKKI